MFTSLKPKLAVALSLSLLGASHFALAQPQPAAAPTTKKVKRGRKSRSGLTTRMQEKIEAALGKPLSADQKAKLDAAADTHRTAVKAADAQFQDEITRVTGLSAAQLKAPRVKTLAPAG